MKKTLLFTCTFVCLALLSVAQGHVDTDSTGSHSAASGGLDITSLAIGGVVGLIVGYLLGSRMGKK